MPYYPERKQDPPTPPMEQNGMEKNTAGEKRAKRRRVLLISLASLSIALAAYGAIRLIAYGVDYFASRRTSEELQRFATATDPPRATREISLETMIVPDPTLTPESWTAEEESDTLLPMSYPENPQLMIPDRFLKLRRKSKYIVGWLSMDGVEEAVAQKDNEYFLTRDALGNKNANGAIFLDEEISLYQRPYTIILYGHNMKSGNMFGRLKKYRESAYYFSHRVIIFDSMYEEGQYAVFAVMDIATSPGTAGWFDLQALMSTSRSQRETAIREMEQRSAFGRVLDVQAEEQLLLLVTCVDSDSERLVVAARRLREGETAENLTYRME